MMIVKAQVSLNDGGATVLVYNEDRSVMQQMPSEPWIIERIGPTKKAYWLVEITENSINIVGNAPEQDW